ncbi:PAS domain S-box-containing protein [Mucilaginibacter lappiensis]|uniref:histidine kinase n=1 Tax=Mucilaginibacter lappiensis TaxID=354630 RepID=A0ABR6PHB0_9SPHI|nr:sensor histidine kinase [Mucilaginibacter lappiensis]MBB6107596.1 PAS domain S-box-containing protein [Mucilaginibacter lappiensis]SIQ03305.1 PAS domain S-box-containing protein [Mucilaginibacter lappiensis]
MNRKKVENKAVISSKDEKSNAAYKQSDSVLNGKSMEMLFQELQMHQVELEMQNDELRIANEQLELQQLKFAGIYDLAPIGYFILDKYGIINEVNNEGVNLLETGKGDIIKNRLQFFVAAEYSDTYHRFYREMLNSGQRQNCHVKMTSKKGTEFYVQMEGIAITPIPTLPLQCDIAVIDITKRVNAEKSLAKTKERLELALEASSAGTWELELDTMKFYLDEFNYQTCAIPGDKFDGKYQTFIQLIHPDDRDMVDQHFRTSLNNQKAIDLVCRFINSSGHMRYASIRGHVITEEGQPHRFVGIMMDISEKRQIEEESARLKHDSQKNIILATLRAEENERRRISDALHDSVSQLLYSIRIKLGTLEDCNDSREVVRNVNELLDMAILETRNISFELAPSILADFGLPATIEELAKRLSTPNMLIKTRIVGFHERLDLQLEIGIFRIIQELVNNCMKHSTADLINIEIKKNRIIEICVKDNGKGFKVEEQEEIPSGSGLSSIKNRMGLYHGHLHIESIPGTGTIVRITLDNDSNQKRTLTNRS